MPNNQKGSTFKLGDNTIIKLSKMGNFGTTEVILVLLVVVLIFAGRKIPELMKGIGQGVHEFKKATSSDQQSFTSSTASRNRSIPFNYFLEAALKARDLLLQESSFTIKRGANFEALLFTSTYVIRRVKQVNPDLNNEFQEGFINELNKYSQKQNFTDYLPDVFIYFFAQRFKINSQEIDLLQKSQQGGFIPLQSVVYNIYDNPLTKSGSFSQNLPASLELTVKIPHVFEFLDKSVSIILQENSL